MSRLPAAHSLAMKAVLFGLLLVVCACSPASTATGITPTAELADPTPSPLAVTPTAQVLLPEQTSTQEPITTLVVWWPDRLAPVGDESVYAWINQQLDDFVESEDNLAIEFRRRRSQEVGGIMATLRSASAVAPGALPDVTLIRREDLLVAVQEGLVQPLDTLVSPMIVADLYEQARRLGTVSEQLYGMPYILEILLMVYNSEAVESVQNTWSFSAMLDNQVNFSFPAARTTGVSEVFLLQYLSAGGEYTPGGPLVVNQAALEETLRFYQEARENDLIDSDVLEYTTTLDYRPLLLNNALDAGIVNSSALISLLSANDALRPASLPTADGTPITLLNGWVWVVVTPNAERRVVAGRFINWMMEPERQSAYVEQLSMLPSLREAMRQRPYAGTSPELLDSLLNNALLPFSDTIGSVTLRAMQNALLAVLSGGSTAPEAAQAAIEQIPGS
jgi:ABC-type glycerol-3-phosphate transport system substrate-binding protein